MSAEHTQGPHPARFSFVATQHRQLREIRTVDRRTNGTTLTLDCGHTSEHAQHFTHTVGKSTFCYACGLAEASKLPEFSGWFDATGSAIVKPEVIVEKCSSCDGTGMDAGVTDEPREPCSPCGGTGRADGGRPTGSAS